VEEEPTAVAGRDEDKDDDGRPRRAALEERRAPEEEDGTSVCGTEALWLTLERPLREATVDAEYKRTPWLPSTLSSCCLAKRRRARIVNNTTNPCASATSSWSAVGAMTHLLRVAFVFCLNRT